MRIDHHLLTKEALKILKKQLGSTISGWDTVMIDRSISMIRKDPSTSSVCGNISMRHLNWQLSCEKKYVIAEKVQQTFTLVIPKSILGSLPDKGINITLIVLMRYIRHRIMHNLLLIKIRKFM